MVHPYSSRRGLGKTFLADRLKGAQSYDRLAGYFASSIVELAGEAMEQVTGKVRILCNAHLKKADVRAAALAQQHEWCAMHPEEMYAMPAGQKRLARFVALMASGKLEIRVLPDEVYGLMHGKGGIITYENGRRSSFVGSINETKSAFALNYELAWEDDDPKIADWMQEEFDTFWQSPYAVPLAQFVVKDAERIAGRFVLPLQNWRDQKEPRPEQAAVEEPVFREENGLWAHQKAFVEQAFRAHRTKAGARFVLADQVGLGKTVQLALAAQLMALYGDKPVLIIVPKTLLAQWQEEIFSLLHLPSAIWLGSGWQDEQGMFYQAEGVSSILRCPRRVGIVSQGLVTRRTEARSLLLTQDYECVVLDEAHRARRRNAAKNPDTHKADANFLLAFLQEISPRTHSLLLATATPVQTHTIEAYDLLTALSPASYAPAYGILGDNMNSLWRKESQTMLDILCDAKPIPRNAVKIWDLMRDPLPLPDASDTSAAARQLRSLRQRLDLPDTTFVLQDYTWLHRQRHTIQDRVHELYQSYDFLHTENPYIRHIIRRTRKTLEETLNPETGLPYLPKIDVKTYDKTALPLLGPYAEAYHQAEVFCQLLSHRVKAGGFLSTMLLKRIGSTIVAGEITAKKLLAWTEAGRDILADEFDEEMELDEAEDEEEDSAVKALTEDEIDALHLLVKQLASCHDEDPKYEKTLALLQQGTSAHDTPWRERGCIIFSQFYDSARFVAEKLSRDLSGERIGLYAGGDKSGVYVDGTFTRARKDELKAQVRARELRILVGTDAASEGLNLQTLATLINLDLPWNPTRLEQRKGRIQRIGQASDTVLVYNLRYKDSIEDKVHEKLSKRLQAVHDLFGQVPDTLSDLWIDVLNEDEERAKERIDVVMKQNPFVNKYDNIPTQTNDWSACQAVLSKEEAQKQLLRGWKQHKV